MSNENKDKQPVDQGAGKSSNQQNGGGIMNGTGDGSYQPPQSNLKAPQKFGFTISRFVVEAGDICNRSMIPVDTLRLLLRGRWDNGNFSQSGSYPSLGGIATMPLIPGQQLMIEPAAGRVVIFDPLEDPQNKELVKRIEATLSNPDNITISPVGGHEVKAHPRAEHKLDDDQMKSILLEMARKVYCPREISTFTAVQGRVPVLEEVEPQPGRELFDHWSNNPERPRYVDQVSAWREKLRLAQASEMAV